MKVKRNTIMLTIGMVCPRCEIITGLIALWDGVSPIPQGECGYCHSQFADMQPEDALALIREGKPELLAEVEAVRRVAQQEAK